MKSLFTLIFMFITLPAFCQGDLSTSVKGQTQTAKVNVGTLEVPGNQITKTGSVGALLETGNKNLLANPSFEHQTHNTSWTSLSGTSALETSVVIDGKKAHKITYSSAFVSLTPTDVTTNAAQFADLSVQGVASVMVKAPFAVKLCARNAGATSTTLCSSPTQGLDKWEQLYYPFVLGATSNGFEIKSDALVTGVAYFDDAFMGPAKVTAITSVVGPWTAYTPTVATLTNSTTTAFWRQNGQDIEVMFRTVLSGTPAATGGISVSLPTGYTVDSAKVANYGGLGAVGYAHGYDLSATSHYNYQVLWGSAGGLITVQNYTTGQVTAVTHTSPFALTTSDGIEGYFKVPVTQFAASTNTLSSTNGNTSWASCGHTTSDFTGFGTVTNIETQCKRDGDDLLMRGKFTPGTGTAVPARVNLKHQGVLLTSAGTGKIPSIQLAGVVAFTGAGSTSGYNLIEPSVGYITFSQQSAGTAGLTKLLGGNYTASQPISISARVPIANWENSNVIVASLKDTPTTIGTTGSDFQSVTFGSGANCATACTTGTCSICTRTGSKITSVTRSAAGIYNINGIDGTKYACDGTGVSPGVSPIILVNNLPGGTSSQAQVFSYGTSGGANTDTGYASVTCIGIP